MPGYSHFDNLFLSGHMLSFEMCNRYFFELKITGKSIKKRSCFYQEKIERMLEKGCYFSDTVSVSVIEPSFIERSNNYDKAIIYPNSAKSYITLNTGHISGNTSFILCNSDGAIIKEGEFIGDIVVNINGLNQGVYFVKINNKNDYRCIKIVVTD